MIPPRRVVNTEPRRLEALGFRLRIVVSVFRTTPVNRVGTDSERYSVSPVRQGQVFCSCKLQITSESSDSQSFTGTEQTLLQARGKSPDQKHRKTVATANLLRAKAKSPDQAADVASGATHESAVPVNRPALVQAGKSPATVKPNFLDSGFPSHHSSVIAPGDHGFPGGLVIEVAMDCGSKNPLQCTGLILVRHSFESSPTGDRRRSHVNGPSARR